MTNLVRQNHPMDQSVDLEVVFCQTPSALFRPKFCHIKYLCTQSLFWRRVALVWCLVLMPWQIELLVFIPAKSQLQCPIKPWNLRSVFWLSGCFHRDSQPLWIIWHFVHLSNNNFVHLSNNNFVHLSKHNFEHLSKHTLRWFLSHLFKLSKHANLWSQVIVHKFSFMNIVHCS